MYDPSIEDLEKRRAVLIKKVEQVGRLEVNSSVGDSLAYFSKGDVHFIDTSLILSMCSHFKVGLENSIANLTAQIEVKNLM